MCQNMEDLRNSVSQYFRWSIHVAKTCMDKDLLKVQDTPLDLNVKSMKKSLISFKIAHCN